MNHRPGRRPAVAVLALTVLALAAVACSSAKSVGAGVNTADKNGKSLAFGQETTTSTTLLQLTLPPPPSAPTTRPRAATEATAPPTTPRRAATTVAVQAFQIITINSDNSSQTQFSPSTLAVYVGTSVHFQNHDSKPRSVVSNDGTSFRSPLIPPGGEWVYAATTAGTFPYQDGTRPYAVGSLTVDPR